jgi:gas vesicle protein
MFKRKKNSILTVASAFVSGAVTGGALALLFAPMTGKKMQRRLTDVTGKVVNRVEELGIAVRRAATA